MLSVSPHTQICNRFGDNIVPLEQSTTLKHIFLPSVLKYGECANLRNLSDTISTYFCIIN
jgi:hypothetical protein